MHATKKVKRAAPDPADALQRIEEVLRLSRSAVWEVDRQGVYTYASASHEALLGYRPEELVGIRTIHDFYPSEMAEELRRELAEDWIGAGEEFADRELPLVTKSGQIVWVTSHGAPIFDGDGRVAGFRGVDTDIMMRKRAEDRLQRDNDKMHLAARAGGIGFWEQDGRTGREEWDDGMLEIHGLRREDFRGTAAAWMEFVHPEDRAALEVAREEARHSRAADFRYDFRIIRTDGETRHIRSIWMAVRDKEGKVVRLMGINQDVTEEEINRRLLEESRERFRLLFEKAPVAISCTDHETGRVYFNEAGEALLGYRRDEDWTREKLAARMFGKTPSDLGQREEMKVAARHSGELLRFELEVTARDGSKHEVEMTCIPLPGVDFKVIIDQTERKRVLRDLHKRSARFRKVVENTPVPIPYTLEGGPARYLNKAFVDAYGWTEADVPDVDAWFENFYPDPVYRQEVLALWNADMEKAQATDGTMAPRLYRIAAKDGSIREVEISAVIFEGEVFGVVLDMTERKRTERLLRASEAQLLGLIENAPLGIVRLDLESGRLRVNKEFTAIFGYTEAEVPTMDEWMRRAYPDAAVRERQRSDWEEALRRARAGDGRIETSEVRVTDASGGEREMQFSAMVAGGEAFCLWVDLTDCKRSAEILRARQEQLMRLGRVSTLGQLAVSLAHELEQPLAAILHNAETADLLLRKGQRINRAELDAIVTDILADDRRAGAVLDRIRAMVRMQRFVPEALPVEALLSDAARLIRPACDRHRVAIEISCDPNLPDIMGDAVLLQQALLNLLLNSMDAIGERGNGRMTLLAGEVKPGLVEISVGDNGGGVPPAELGSLFEPFFTTKKEGLGMGLPLVQSIVEQHEGKLRVANQPGRGLVVGLQLPVWPEDPAG